MSRYHVDQLVIRVCTYTHIHTHTHTLSFSLSLSLSFSQVLSLYYSQDQCNGNLIKRWIRGTPLLGRASREGSGETSQVSGDCKRQKRGRRKCTTTAGHNRPSSFWAAAATTVALRDSSPRRESGVGWDLVRREGPLRHAGVGTKDFPEYDETRFSSLSSLRFSCCRRTVAVEARWMRAIRAIRVQEYESMQSKSTRETPRVFFLK